MTYRYLQGITYGPRDGTLGLSFHMSEGYDGLPQYLAQRPSETRAQWRDRVNGVSCHVAILSTGEVWQMLDWDHASGNLNPDDRSAEYGYYGASHLKKVLGTHWPDPNAWTLSAELAGFRSAGPTDAQVRSAIQWGREMKALFPSLRGAIGHHDQSPKPCPGLTPNMRRIFDGVGGHGLWTTEEDVPGVAVSITDRYDGTAIVSGPGHAYILVRDGRFVPIPAGWPGPEGKEVVYRGYLTKPYTTPGGTIIPAETKVIGVGLDEAILLEKDVILTPREKDVTGELNAALDHVAGPAADVLVAIEEARPR